MMGALCFTQLDKNPEPLVNLELIGTEAIGCVGPK